MKIFPCSVVVKATPAVACLSVAVLLPSARAADSVNPVIVVTPGSIEQPRSEAMAPVTIVSAEDIRESGANHLSDLLRGQAGVMVQDLFGDGSQTTVDLRGFGPTASSNSLILLDGMRLTHSTDNAAPDLSMIKLDDIERIEILQGSGGVLYGNQAVGGVINIIRKKVTRDRTRVGVKLGSYNSQDVDVLIERLLGQSQLELSANDHRSDNYRDHNRSERQSVHLRATHQHRSFTGYVELDASDSHLLTPGALLEDEMDDSRTQSLAIYEDDFFDTQSRTVRAGTDTFLSDTASMKVDVSYREDDRNFTQTFRPAYHVDAEQQRNVSSLSATYRKKLEVNSFGVTLLAGLQLEQTDYKLVTSLGPQQIDQTITGAFVSSQWGLSQHSQLQAGLRLSDQQADITDVSTSLDQESFNDQQPLWGLGYTWSNQPLKLFARAERNVRYPTVEEHTNVPYGYEPGLQTQQGLSLEMGAEINSQAHRYRLTAYNIELDNEIAFDSTGFANLNLDRTSRDGLIAEWFTDWSERLSMSLSVTWLDAKITDGAFKGNLLPLVAEQTLRVDGGYRFDERWNFGLEYQWVGATVFGGDFANQLDKLPSYQVVNAHLHWQYQHWEARLRVNNLLNEKYSESGSQYTEYHPVTFAPSYYESFFPSAERNLWLSVSYSFE